MQYIINSTVPSKFYRFSIEEIVFIYHSELILLKCSLLCALEFLEEKIFFSTG